VPELRERGRVPGVVPEGTDREKRRPGPWVEALRVASSMGSNTAHREWRQQQRAASAADRGGQRQWIKIKLPMGGGPDRSDFRPLG
jgi:hypothetical protein